MIATASPALAEQFDRLMAAYPGPLVGAATREFAVIDVDPRNGGDVWLTSVRQRLPETRVHRTRSGGWHLFFRATPGLRSAVGRIAPGVDVRSGAGSGVIWWPFEGLPWHKAPLTEWPVWLLDEQPIRRERMGSPTGAIGALGEPIPLFNDSKPTNRERNYATAALRRAQIELEATVEGQRNHKLNVLAFNMGRLTARGWLDERVAVGCLESTAYVCGLLRDGGKGAVLATIRSGLRAGLSRPYHDLDRGGSP